MISTSGGYELDDDPERTDPASPGPGSALGSTVAADHAGEWHYGHGDGGDLPVSGKCITMPAAMTAAAASNFFWISCPNSSARQSLWPAFFVRADGVTAGRLRRNVAGMLITTVDTEAPLYDSTAAWRRRAMAGVLHSGAAVTGDPRPDDRTALQAAGWRGPREISYS